MAPANRLIEDEQFVYEYNPDGNLIRKGIKADGKEWRYGYDIYDRLTSAGLYAGAGASSPDKLKTYVYDAFDRRVSAFDETAGGLSSATPARHTLHDEWNVLVQQESPQGSGGPASSQSRRWFTQGGEDDIAAVTPNAPGALDPGTSSIYASTDHLGSVRALHDDNGTVVADLDHDTFGNREVAVESFAQPFGYTGREYDADTGLYHYRAREYDPVAGRFLQEDPIWYASGDMNVYRYVLSNPVRYRDPSGNATEYAQIVRIGLLGALYGAIAGEVSCILRTGGSGLREFTEHKITTAVVIHARECGVEVVVGMFAGAAGSLCRYSLKTNHEIAVSKDLRIAPCGNTPKMPPKPPALNLYAKLPHYHRRVKDPLTNQTRPCQGIGRHRPWESCRDDRTFWDRF